MYIATCRMLTFFTAYNILLYYYAIIIHALPLHKSQSRRLFLQTSGAVSGYGVILKDYSFESSSLPFPSLAYEMEGDDENWNDGNDNEYTIALPMERCEGGANCIRFVIMDGDGCAPLYVRAIVDTGSPYMIVSAEEMRDREELQQEINDGEKVCLPLAPSVSPTVDVYGSVQGRIDFRTANDVQFRDTQLKLQSDSSLMFGVLDEQLSREAGGNLIGLIRDWNSNYTRYDNRSRKDNGKVDVQPSILDQLIISIPNKISTKHLKISSFMIDSGNKKLLLSTCSLINKARSMTKSRDSINRMIMPLIDLRSPPWGDFIDHYACLVNDLYVNGISVEKKGLIANNKSICVVFDTGLSGCLFSQQLWDDVFSKPGDLENLTSVQVNVKAIDRKSIVRVFADNYTAGPMFYVKPVSLDWFDNDVTSPYIVVVGQAFLADSSLTIDIDDRQLMLQT